MSATETCAPYRDAGTISGWIAILRVADCTQGLDWMHGSKNVMNISCFNKVVTDETGRLKYTSIACGHCDDFWLGYVTSFVDGTDVSDKNKKENQYMMNGLRQFPTRLSQGYWSALGPADSSAGLSTTMPNMTNAFCHRAGANALVKMSAACFFVSI